MSNCKCKKPMSYDNGHCTKCGGDVEGAALLKINDVPFEVTKEVSDLILNISIERDKLKEELVDKKTTELALASELKMLRAAFTKETKLHSEAFNKFEGCKLQLTYTEDSLKSVEVVLEAARGISKIYAPEGPSQYDEFISFRDELEQAIRNHDWRKS